jgi:transcriptional regulator with XRE-family HTH domain
MITRRLIMNVEIANKLVKLRKQMGLSQEELAEKIGVSRQAVSKWERSESSPDTDNLIALSKIYGISIDEMLDYDVDSKPKETPTETYQEQYTYDTSGSADEDMYDEESEPSRNWNSFPIAIVATIIFFCLGFFWGLWHPGWLVFLLIPVFHVTVKHKRRKGKKISPWELFPYPILATAIFLLIGFIWGGWSYAWLVFLTIPIWAFFVSKPKEKK